jgi:hypothetical protein
VILLEIPEALVGEERLITSLQDLVERSLFLPNMDDGVLVQSTDTEREREEVLGGAQKREEEEEEGEDEPYSPKCSKTSTHCTGVR